VIGPDPISGPIAPQEVSMINAPMLEMVLIGLAPSWLISMG
jgi:hypothetical protein